MKQQRWTSTTAWLALGFCSASASLCLTNMAVAQSRTSVTSELNAKTNTPEQRTAAAIRFGKQKSSNSAKQLAAWLADDNTLVRQSAAWALTQLGDAAEPAVSQLTQALSDRDARVRWAAATSLGNIGQKAEEAEAALIRTVLDRDADVQCAAIIALRSLEITDERAVSAALSDCLNSELTDVQTEALATLTHLIPRCSESTKQDLVPSLTKTLATKDDEVRLAAVVLLGDVGLAATPAITALTRAANDLDEHVESAAIRTLNRLADEIDQRWNGLDVSQREALQQSCEIVVRKLSAPASTESDQRRSQLANRFRQLCDGIQIASQDSTADRSAVRKGDGRTIANVAGHAWQRSDVPLDDDASEAVDTNGTATVASGSNERWLWGLYAVIVGVGFWLLKQLVNRLGENVQSANHGASSNFNTATMLPKTSSFAEANRALNQSADEDQLIAHVVPAVVASLPAGSAEDDVSTQDNMIAVPIATSPSAGRTLLPVTEAAMNFDGTTDKSARPTNSAVAAERPHENTNAVSKQLERSHAADIATRRDAVNELSDIALDVTARLNRAMHDDDSVVRWRSASAVTAAHGATIPQLLAATTATDPDVRRLAVTSLQGLGGEAVAPFVQALKDQNADVRHAAATALGRIGLGAIDAIPQLIAALQDADERVRASAAFSLSTFGRHAFEAVPALQKALSDSSAAVRSRAAFTLGQVGPAAKRAVKELARLISDADPIVRRNSASALGGIGTDAAAAIPELLSAAHDSDATVRSCVISVIGLIAPHAATDTLQRALHDSDAEVRECARAALSAPTHAMLKVFQPQEQSPLSNPEQAEIADLIAVIQQSDNEEARWNASQKLAECGNRAVSSIVTALQHADSEVRRQLIHTLGRIGKGAREAVHALLPAMQDADAPVRSAAAETLGRLGIVNPSMLQALSKALTDQDSEVRRHSAMTLGRFGQYAHTISIDLQVAALGDSDLKVRNAAHAALQRITESLAKAA